jgi:lysozyme
MPVQFIDVSNHQGEIDWVKVKNAGKRGAFIKATEGTF